MTVPSPKDPAPFATRRVVTGRTADGRSTVLFDGPSPCRIADPDTGLRADLLWWSEGSPADNSGTADLAERPFPPSVSPAEGSAMFIARYPPLSHAGHEVREKLRTGGIKPSAGHRPGMHATDSLDYVVVLAGEITMILEDRDVVLRAGDTVIDRGILHAWENRGDVTAVIASITVGANKL